MINKNIGTGKTSLLGRYVDDVFSFSSMTTIATDIKIKTIQLNGHGVKLHIWDTTGHERYRAISPDYYRKAMGVLCIYDITDEQSFENLSTWFTSIDKHAPDNVNKVLIGTKSDLESRRRVDTIRAEQFASEFGIRFFETSAKDNTNVTESFTQIASDVMERLMGSPAPSPHDQHLDVDLETKDHNETQKKAQGCSIL